MQVRAVPAFDTERRTVTDVGRAGPTRTFWRSHVDNDPNPARSGSKGTVLVVDDDTALAEMLTIVLNNEGFETVVCSSGDKALGMFREERPDIVLLDLMLPGMAGGGAG